MTIGRAVPAFHRQDAPAVAGPHRRPRPRIDPLSERRATACGTRRLEAELDVERGEPCMKRVGSLQAGDAGIRHSRIVYPIRRLDSTALLAVRRLSLISMLPRRILPMMSSRGALAVALFVAVITQAAGICQLRCVTPGQSPVSSHHSCHASASSLTDIAIVGLDEGCQHLSGVTAVLATPPHASVASVAHSATLIVLHDSWKRASFASHAHARFGPPISSAGTLRI